MLNSITIGRYCYRDSLIHRWNPVCKLISSILYILFVFQVEQWIQVCLFSLFLLMLLLLSGFSVSYYFRPIWNLRYMIFALIFFYFLFGIPFYQSFLLIWKMVVVILYSMMVLYTTPIGDLTYALTILMYPLSWFGIPVLLMSRMIGLSLSFLPNIMEQARRILKSLTVRGMDYKYAHFKQKLQIWKMILFPLMDNSFRYADTVADTMEVRLYSVDQKIRFRKMSIHFWDMIQLVLHIGLCLFAWRGVILCGI